MSTPEQPMTRRLRRELERTGALQIPTAASPTDADADTGAESQPVPVVSSPRIEEPVSATPEPVDEEIDLDARPLTRRQARLQERLRTASLPVITPEEAVASAEVEVEAHADVEIDAEHVAEAHSDTAVTDAVPADADEAPAEAEEESADADEESAEPDVPSDQESADTDAQVVDAEIETADEVDSDAVEDAEVEVELEAEVVEDAGVEADVVEDAGSTEDDDTLTASSGAEVSAADADRPEASAGVDIERDEPTATVGPQFGAALLAGDTDVEVVDLPPSFDEIIARNASSTTSSTPSALILSQAPTAPSLAGPIAATGELIVTGSYPLPEGLGSTGVPTGATDGREVDAVLIDGELPAASSPTPVAASAAVSTSRGADEIIRPPVPEKGGRLILALAITAGVLAIAVVGVLVVALVNGVFL